MSSAVGSKLPSTRNVGMISLIPFSTSRLNAARPASAPSSVIDSSSIKATTTPTAPLTLVSPEPSRSEARNVLTENSHCPSAGGIGTSSPARTSVSPRLPWLPPVPTNVQGPLRKESTSVEINDDRVAIELEERCPQVGFATGDLGLLVAVDAVERYQSLKTCHGVPPFLPVKCRRPSDYCPRLAGSTPANARKSTMRKLPRAEARRQLGRPVRRGREPRVAIAAQQAEEHLADDAAADRPEVLAAAR